MIFQHTWQLICKILKSQTRRPDDDLPFEYMYPNSTIHHVAIPGETPMPTGEYTITAVFTKAGRLKWRVGRTYAVQPGRGQKAVARILITGIRRERVCDISEADVRAEGCVATEQHPIQAFADLWDSIHTKPGTRWEDAVTVWVLEFELVGEGRT